MSKEQWDAEPSWYTTLLLGGLEDQGIIGDKNNKTGSQGSSSGTPAQPAAVDYASGEILPPGFTQTRRAG